MFQTAVLASGSKGNCILVSSNKSCILVDAGISIKQIFANLDKLNYRPKEIQAIFVTHEHTDHIHSVGALSRKLQIPIYITNDTYHVSKNKLGELYGRIKFIEVGKPITYNDLIIHPFPSPHDAIDSCNFTFVQIDNTKAKLSIATDVGYQSRLLTKHLSNSTTIILESNHDRSMLIQGPYKWNLKQRIMSNQGHLSNTDAVGVISQVIHSELKNLILAHVSEINNLPSTVESVMLSYFKSINFKCNLFIANQYEPTPLINV